MKVSGEINKRLNTKRLIINIDHITSRTVTDVFILMMLSNIYLKYIVMSKLVIANLHLFYYLLPL